MVSKIQEHLAASEEGSNAQGLYRGMKIALEALGEVIACYRNRAVEKREMAKKKGR